MRKIIVLIGASCLVGCSGGSGGVPNETATGSGGVTTGTACTDCTAGYTTSQPLADNSNASAYKVLLMGNSHAAALQTTLRRLLVLGQPGKPVDVQVSPGWGFLADRIDDVVSKQKLESELWSHVILQAQKYSSTGTNSYPTTAAEFWIRGAKELGATPIMFPEHPRKGNTWEGQTLWELHTGIAVRENTCVAPVGLVWDEVIFRDASLTLHQFDGNHASEAGVLLTALVFYQVITGQPVESLPRLSAFNIDPATEQIMKASVSSLLYRFSPCAYEI
jgi:hypothetical protein